MEEKVIDGRDVISINKYRLDEEFIKQPDLMLYYTNELAMSQKAVADCDIKCEALKDELKALKANLDIKIRIQSKDTGTKLTEAGIESMVLSDKSVAAHQERYYQERTKLNALTESRDKLQGFVDALRHRKSSLENLSTLYVSGYYSQPKSNDVYRAHSYKQREALNNKNKEYKNEE